MTTQEQERRNVIASEAGYADAMAEADDSIPSSLLRLVEEQRVKLREQNSSMRRMETWMAQLVGRIEKLEAMTPPPLFPDDKLIGPEPRVPYRPKVTT